VGWHELGRSGGHPVPYRLVDLGPLVLTTAVATPTRKQSVLDRLLGGRRARLPAGREAILISPGPRSSTGYDVEVLSIVEERRRIVVDVREIAPKLGDRVRGIVTYPYRLVMMPASTKHVTIRWEGR
jgi:PrcB C-terminal